MSQLVKALLRSLALPVLILALANGARGSGEEPVQAQEEQPPAAAVETETEEFGPISLAAGWLIIGVSLLVSLSAGGYTVLCYLRRRDALSTLAALEARYQSSSDFM